MDTIGGDLRQMQRTQLVPAHFEALRKAGREKRYPAGIYLAGPPRRSTASSRSRRARSRFLIHLPTGAILPQPWGLAQFMGEIAFLIGGNCSLATRAVRESRMIEVPREAMLTLKARVPEMSHIIITLVSARRRRQLDDRDSALVLIVEDVDRNIRSIAEFASRNRIPYTSLAMRTSQAVETADERRNPHRYTGGDFRAQHTGR